MTGKLPGLQKAPLITRKYWATCPHLRRPCYPDLTVQSRSTRPIIIYYTASPIAENAKIIKISAVYTIIIRKTHNLLISGSIHYYWNVTMITVVLKSIQSTRQCSDGCVQLFLWRWGRTMITNVPALVVHWLDDTLPTRSEYLGGIRELVVDMRWGWVHKHEIAISPFAIIANSQRIPSIISESSSSLPSHRVQRERDSFSFVKNTPNASFVGDFALVSTVCTWCGEKLGINTLSTPSLP